MKFKKAFKKVLIMYHMKEIILVTSCRKNIIRLIVYITVLLAAVVVCSIPYILIQKQQPAYYLRFQTDLKYILLWKPNDTILRSSTNNTIVLKRNIQKQPEGQTLFIKQKCKQVNCYITYDQNLLGDPQNLDAVVFNVKDIISLKSSDLNLPRSPDQMYIFRSLEPSDKYPICHKSFDKFFNWTWTYKLNSNIPHTFFNVYDANSTLVGPKIFVNWTKNMKHNDRFNYKIKNKTKAVAWVTNCKLKSKYEEFVTELRNELKSYNYTLDTFGFCGNSRCPDGNIMDCYKMIEKKYYFQLIIEDSLVKDYVTEKLGTAMTYLNIPIVLGNTKYSSFLPPGSYINANAFDIKKLGAIIIYLIKNPVPYSSFFDWKNYYYFTLRPMRDVCSLCAKLNDNAMIEKKRAYFHFRKWWNGNYKETCKIQLLENMFLKTNSTYSQDIAQ